LGKNTDVSRRGKKPFPKGCDDLKTLMDENFKKVDEFFKDKS